MFLCIVLLCNTMSSSSTPKKAACGFPIRKQENFIVLEHKGTKIAFCTNKCADLFKEDPEKFKRSNHYTGD